LSLVSILVMVSMGPPRICCFFISFFGPESKQIGKFVQ
jgi:hypothetical protein